MRFLQVILGCILFIIGLAACQSTDPASSVPENTESETVTPEFIPENVQTQSLIPALTSTMEETDMAPIVTPDADTQKLVTLVQGHLAQKLGIPADEIVLVELRSVRWRDSGLGCAKPGVDYLPMETPGYNILLEAGGQTYNYHTDQIKRFILCNR